VTSFEFIIFPTFLCASKSVFIPLSRILSDMKKLFGIVPFFGQLIRISFFASPCHVLIRESFTQKGRPRPCLLHEAIIGKPAFLPPLSVENPVAQSFSLPFAVETGGLTSFPLLRIVGCVVTAFLLFFTRLLRYPSLCPRNTFFPLYPSNPC